MAKFQTTITKDGAFFERDPAKTFRANVRDFMDAVAREGEADVTGQLRAGESGRKLVSSGVHPARVSAHVIGRTKALTGKRWDVSAVVSVQQAVALMAAASRLEGRGHAFRRTAGRLKRARAANLAGLLKGIA